VTEPSVVVIFIGKRQLQRQNGRRRHTRELEWKEAVRARIVVAVLPARVFPDRWTRRLVVVRASEPEFAMLRFSFVLIRRLCFSFVRSSNTVRHRHGVGLEMFVQRQQSLVVHQRRGQMLLIPLGHLQR